MDQAREYVRQVLRDEGGLSTNELLDQHFLVSDGAITRELVVLPLRRGARIAELGAGIGTVARMLPQDVCLTLVELDPRLCRILRRMCASRPESHVVEGDAIAWTAVHHVDGLVCNLPWTLDEPLLEVLATLDEKDLPRALVMAADPRLTAARAQRLCPRLDVRDQGLLDAEAFWPPQAEPSRLLVAKPHTYEQEGR